MGIETVNANLNKQLGKLTAKSVPGMRQVMILLRADMDTTPPLIPVDFGNLRASWFNEFITDLQTGNVGVIFGFSANYAAFVHELMDGDFSSPRVRYNPKRKYTPRAGAGPKFLEAALKRNTGKILQIMGGSMK